MLFNATDTISPAVADAIARGVLAVDAFALVRVDAPNRLIQIDGRMTPAQAVATIGNAGCDARLAEPIEVGHVQGGSTCCGHCT